MRKPSVLALPALFAVVMSAVGHAERASASTRAATRAHDELILRSADREIPAWARRYNVNCSFCHAPAAPRLNATGIRFRWAGYRMPEDIGTQVSVDDVKNYIALRGRVRYVYDKTNGQPTSTSGFQFSDATLFVAGSDWVRILALRGVFHPVEVRRGRFPLLSLDGTSSSIRTPTSTRMPGAVRALSLLIATSSGAPIAATRIRFLRGGSTDSPDGWRAMTAVDWLLRGLAPLVGRRWGMDCPAGSPVPEVERCAALDCDSVRLTMLDVGDAARVTCLEAPGTPESRKLAGLGILPGVGLVLLQRSPVFVFRWGRVTPSSRSMPASPSGSGCGGWSNRAGRRGYIRSRSSSLLSPSPTAVVVKIFSR